MTRSAYPGVRWCSSGTKRRGRGVQAGHHHVHVAGQVVDDIPHRPQRFGALVGAPEEQPELHGRPDLVRPELEVGDDPEVAAATANRPEQVRVLRRRRPADLAVGGDDLRREQVVDGQAARAAQPSHPTAQGEPADTGVTHQAGRHGQPVSLGGGIHVAQEGSTADPHPLGHRIDRDVVQPAQIDHETVVRDARARRCCARHRGRRSPAPARSPNLTAAATSAALAHCAIKAGRRSIAGVPDRARRVVLVVGGFEHSTGHRRPQARARAGSVVGSSSWPVTVCSLMTPPRQLSQQCYVTCNVTGCDRVSRVGRRRGAR